MMYMFSGQRMSIFFQIELFAAFCALMVLKSLTTAEFLGRQKQREQSCE